ncbi:hypothetical protein SARC_08447 [Sphaeroforma arctica JP610]|uniref:C2H2-type domain-containing protein n=1 Tax=Sphaeroforma arctica JP610 TaxID=667725 RepID=A0A0L0FT67_9EUKA|nr:hypothetical protein SARC_08447 [Sphaeroforma arctica JP610]KNC79148.1 hypothetical protein SARC_08447 [Sphaeroforma arctica JP610]|eukprot:XP_014153050.1 hypothetical protein SARC_08447 [Sphaeroforma arctica JP610]
MASGGIMHPYYIASQRQIQAATPHSVSISRVLPRSIMNVARMGSYDSFASTRSSSTNVYSDTCSDEDVESVDSGMEEHEMANEMEHNHSQDQPLHSNESMNSILAFRCEKCGKKYKQRNSLFKHQWEHSEFWEPTARKFNMSKHQQVQAMQAAMQLMNFSSAGEYDWTKELPEVRFLDLK